MSNVFKVTTANIIRTKEADIDGVVYIVRNKGGGDTLDMSIVSSKIAKISKAMLEIKNKFNTVKKDEEKMSLLGDMEELTGKMLEAQTNLENCYAALFDDGGDQKKAKAMVHKYGVEGIEKILQQIFGAENEAE